MSVSHIVEYSRTSKAVCSASCSCPTIEVGSLRYGRATSGSYGNSVQWRHWGCLSPQMLSELASCGAANITGFQKLRPEDKKKITTGISNRNTSAISRSSAALPIPPSTIPANGMKRKSDVLNSGHSQFGDEEEENPEDEIQEELYVTLDCEIKGIQYYSGLVGPAEEVSLVREPTNLYDRNAIQVKNARGVQIGHIAKNIASRLAPLLDKRLINVEGVMQEGNLGGGMKYTLAMTLKIYGDSFQRDLLEPQLIWATPRQRGFPPRKPAAPNAAPSSSAAQGAYSNYPGLPAAAAAAAQFSAFSLSDESKKVRNMQDLQEALTQAADLQNMLSTLERVNDEGRRSSLLDTVCSKEDVLNLPLHSNPPGITTGQLTVNLLKHQSQALQWCIERENPKLPSSKSDKPVQFWQIKQSYNKTFYYNIATKTPQPLSLQPRLGRGALCADAMGLGKTLTMLALIIATKSDNSPGFSKTTLIIAPLSVISNWSKQIEDHLVDRTLSVYMYYGGNRSISADQLQKFDAVITTYQTVAAEYSSVDSAGSKRRKVDKSLFDVKWKRIILDEGHIIRNPKTKMANAVYALEADRRWVLTGTPIINSPTDLGSILTFLKICSPLDEQDYFKRLLLRPLKQGDPEGAELLRALMSHICLRRTKEMQDSQGTPLVSLPPVEMIVVPVALHPDARALYDEVEMLSQRRIEKLVNSQNMAVVQSSALSMLTRMRQLALHPGLLPLNYVQQLRGLDGPGIVSNTGAATVTSETRARLQSILAQHIEDCEECPICMNMLDNPRITPCGHSFCLNCISECIHRDPHCPMDRGPIVIAQLIEPCTPSDLTQAPVKMHDKPLSSEPSAKIEQLLRLLQLTAPDEKSLVFSQFTSFLDKIGEALDDQGIAYVRFDGRMSAKRREEAIQLFSVPVDPSSIPVVSATREKDTILDRDDSSDFAFTRNEDSDDDESDFDIDPSKGKGKAREDSDLIDSSMFACGGSPRIMLISLKAGALGLNLTVANNVYLMDPWWQEGIESQAIDRCNRIGQKKDVHVYQLMAENTVEAKVLEIQERKKKLVQEAFSGMHRKETQREKREARLNDLVELFGVRMNRA